MENIIQAETNIISASTAREKKQLEEHRTHGVQDKKRQVYVQAKCVCILIIMRRN